MLNDGEFHFFERMLAMSFDSKLKAVTVEAIQNAVAKALSELVDEDFVCTVSELHFEGAFRTAVRLEIGPRIDVTFGKTKVE